MYIIIRLNTETGKECYFSTFKFVDEEIFSFNGYDIKYAQEFEFESDAIKYLDRLNSLLEKLNELYDSNSYKNTNRDYFKKNNLNNKYYIKKIR